jgi:phosphopantothenoylcysteine decarboxylase / phosphopantothenate---cysteine ligase
MKKRIVIGITGGIAAYKIIDLIKSLKRKAFDVGVIMTASAQKIVKPQEIEKITGCPIYTELFPKQFSYQDVLKNRTVDHIQIADMSDLIVIAPATANIIGKLAHGIADDFLSTTILAARAPILICPSMNVHMWENQIVQDNVKKLQNYGMQILYPEKGPLACGYEGDGRLPDSVKIEAVIENMLKHKNRLHGKTILVTAGGTSEPIDAVRTITNKSTGKMGVALAESCYARGAHVILLRSGTSVDTNYPVEKYEYETGKELQTLVMKYVSKSDVIFHNAAVSDYIPASVHPGKLDSKKPFTLQLERTIKILNQIKKWNAKIMLIGFKAVFNEAQKNLIDKGIQKLNESKADFIIVNDVGKEGIGFGVDDNEVYIISPRGLVKKIEKTTKKEIAQKILDCVFS